MTVTSSCDFYVTSYHKHTETTDVIGVVTQHVEEFSDGTKTVENRLKFYNDPKRPYWITKPQFRDHEFKKEFESIDKCDMHICRDSDLERDLSASLGYPTWGRIRPLRQLCSSPYVYGADIPTETLVKQAIMHKVPVGKIANYSKGGFDIESEVTGEKRINVITFIHEHEIFTCALREYCEIWDVPGDPKSYHHPATEDDVRAVIDRLLGSYLHKHQFNVTFKICDTELDLIKWIFAQIHKCKTNYIGIWNMGFDIPKIIERIEALGADPEAIMCHPEVPKAYRYVKWFEDKATVAHFTDKWHWVSIAGYSQFVDSMCLYARLRKVNGRDSSYSLDAISNKELGQGKLHFGDITNHSYQQRYNFLEYIAYNINDVMIMMLMEWKNSDLSALSGLCGVSTPREFSRQTAMLRNDAYVYARSKGYVPASAALTMFGKVDKSVGKAGGTVLPPNKATGVGISATKELAGLDTMVSVLANDLDYTSMYPSFMKTANISRETELMTAISVNGYPLRDIEKLFSNLLIPEVGAIEVATYFYELPSYTGMAKDFDQYLASKNKD